MVLKLQIYIFISKIYSTINFISNMKIILLLRKYVVILELYLSLFLTKIMFYFVSNYIDNSLRAKPAFIYLAKKFQTFVI